MKTKRGRSCKSCGAEAAPGQCRCENCLATFEQWLRDEHPTVYKPRQDGVWKDPAR